MKIFVSSTCNDMKHERDIVERVIKDNGHEAIRSDRVSFAHTQDCHPHDNCLLVLNDCDYVVVLIGSEYGKIYDGNIMKSFANRIYEHSKEKPSITWIELAYAIKCNKPYAILLDSEVYSELKLFRRNSSDKSIGLNRVKDTRVFTFIHYYNNKNNCHWMTIYRDVGEIEIKISQICSQLKNGSLTLKNERSRLAEIMPGFTYRSKNKMALVYVRNRWEDYNEALWELKSHMFQRGFEACVIDYVLGNTNYMELTHCSSILFLLNKHNLSAVKKLISRFIEFDHIVIFVAGDFVRHNVPFLKQFFEDADIDNIHLIPYSTPQTIFRYLVPYLNECVANYPVKDMSVIEELGLENAQKCQNNSSISMQHPTIAYLRYSGNYNNIPTLYTSKGCRNGCRICGPGGYRLSSIYQALDDNVMEQLSTLYELGHQKICILDQDIFSCGHERIERLLYISKRFFPDIKFEINFLINELTREQHITYLNKFYNYGLGKVNYFLCQEGDVEKSLDLFKKIINQQNKDIATKVIIYLGRKTESMKFYDNLSKIMRSSKKQYSQIQWDIRFTTPEIIDGKISVSEGYRVCFYELSMFDAKKPVMFYSLTASSINRSPNSPTPRTIRNKILEIYSLASNKDSNLNPPLSTEVAETFKLFSKDYNGSDVSGLMETNGVELF